MTVAQENSVQAQAPPPGVFVPVPTFFKNSGKASHPEVDVETQILHSIHLAGAGIHGLVLLGSTGEAVHLSKKERKDLVRRVRQGLAEAGYPEYPIMAGVLTNSAEDAVEELRAMKESGADWGLVLVPGYFGAAVDQANIVKWYTEVAEQSPMGILIYNYPGVTNGVLVAPDTYFELAAHPKIVGCKMSHGNMSHHLQVSLAPSIDHANFSLYSGFGQQLFPVVSCGGAGVIDGLASIYPHVVATLFEEARAPLPMTAERLAKIQALQWHVSRGNEIIGKYGIVGIKEAIYRELALGNMQGGRLPLQGSMPEGTWEASSHTFGELKKLELQLAKLRASA